MTRMFELRSKSVGETLEIGRAVGARLVAGDTVALVGILGAGKTHLVKGIAGGLGVTDERLINSPTFVLVNEYEGRLHVYHVDAYRLKTVPELEWLGFEEMCGSGGVVVVEWADRVAGAVDSLALWIELAIVGEEERVLALRTESEAVAERVNKAGLDRGRTGGQSAEC